MREIIINNCCGTKVLIQNKTNINEEIFGFNKVILISDSNVFKIYGKNVLNKLSASNKYTFKFVVEAGERSKNIKNVINIIDFLSRSSFSRNDAVITLGGGMISDLGGFAASIYKRGIKLFHIPTTILSAVDASIGGKTGVNTEFGKNMMGTFYNPLKVLVSLDYFKSLPEREVSCGKAEILKYAFIKDTEILKTIKQGDVERVIEKSVRVKKFFVEQDEFDHNKRMILNFGHTIGHAVEKCSNYKVSHGEAVSIGMATMARYFGLYEVESIIEENGLPVTFDADSFDLIKFIRLDKKREDEMYNIVVPLNLGECEIRRQDEGQILKILKRVKG